MYVIEAFGHSDEIAEADETHGFKCWACAFFAQKEYWQDVKNDIVLEIYIVALGSEFPGETVA